MATARIAVTRPLISALLVAIPFTLDLQAQDKYQTPPKAVRDVIEAVSSSEISTSPDRGWILITIRDRQTKSIADLAEREISLAGNRVKPMPDYKIRDVGIRSATVKRVDGTGTYAIPIPAGGRLGAAAWSPDGRYVASTAITKAAVMGVQVSDVARAKTRTLAAASLRGKLSAPDWSADGRRFVFSAATKEGIALWLGDASAGTLRQLIPAIINHVNGGCSWINGQAPLLCRVMAANRGPEPKQPDVPTGPIVQESYGRAAPTRTYEDLLKSPYDEALFDYYYTNQLALVQLDGTMRRLGAPGIYTSAAPSPDGRYILVSAVHRPYSYQVMMGWFPIRTDVWDRSGKVVKTIFDRPLTDNLSSARDAVEAGIRGIRWRDDAPATLVYAEALDNGDPTKAVPKRDRVSLLPAPFTGTPMVLAETEYRLFGNIQWIKPTLALLSERTRQKQRMRTWVIDPSQPSGGTPRILWDRNTEDRYGDPGSIATAYDRAKAREVPLLTPDSQSVYLTGAGASAEGERPFLDRLNLSTGQTERLWRSAAPYYEWVAGILNADVARVLISRESRTEPPNYYLRDAATGALTKLTDLPDPAPFFSKVTSQLITYTRNDGVKLSATLYLPPGYDKNRDGRLPFLVWAYPQEFFSADAASQLTGSPYQYRRPTPWQDHLYLLAAGYGVLDGPTIPIVSKDGKEPNDDYVNQLVASAQAAVDTIVAMGVADRDRIGVGGHSYGAFMTANLLAHSDIFRAGIARSGAYNRSLTPFGFQAEPRTYWQARDVYIAMSPFTFADKITTPLLLIHGMKDSNSGTFPIQSERLFAAVKGQGGNIRYVQLPLEDHGYGAVESQGHVMWEMITWLDTYVKNAKARTTAAN